MSFFSYLSSLFLCKGFAVGHRGLPSHNGLEWQLDHATAAVSRAHCFDADCISSKLPELFVLGVEVKNIFIASGLPQQVLAHIWYAVINFCTIPIQHPG